MLRTRRHDGRTARRPLETNHLGDRTAEGRLQPVLSHAGFTLIEILATALDSYRMDNDFYPSTVQGIAALRTKPLGTPTAANWRSPYLRKDVPLDPWKKPYLYLSPGQVNPESYDLLTYGRDGKPGGEGEDADVTSWQ